VKPDRTEATEEPTLVLNLTNQPAVIEESRLAVVAFLEPLGVVTRTMNRVEVVLEELLSNLIRHGRDVNAIMVAAGYRGGSIDLVVEDDGAVFDPLGKPDPDPFTSLAEAPLGGLGIALVRRLTCAARYDRVGTGAAARNRVSVSITNR
jgi:anti-sigma regulatory factor (Ser/Thr protein kinase)